MSHGWLTAARAALVMFAALSPIAPGHAAVPDKPWQGIIAHGDQKVRVRLTTERGRLVMHFGEPANCNIVAERFDSSDLGDEYRFRPPANGGAFCNRLYPGAATLRSEGETGLVVSFPRQGRAWRGLLTHGTP